MKLISFNKRIINKTPQSLKLLRSFLITQGLGKRISKGAKNLDELGENLAKRFKFKGFSLELKGRWFTLYGIINPKVPLAKGQVNLSKDSYKKVASNARANKALKLMDEVTGGHTHGRHSATKADKWLFDRAFDR